MDRIGPERVLEQMLAEPEEAGSAATPKMRATLAAELMWLDWNAPAEFGEGEAAQEFLKRLAAETSPVPPELVAAVVADCVREARKPAAAARRVWSSPRLARRAAWVGGAIAASVAVVMIARTGKISLPPAGQQNAASVEPAKSAAQATVAVIGPGGTASLPSAGERIAQQPVYTAPNPPQPITSHAVTAEDYPAESIAQHQEGSVRVEYLIQTDGGVGECRVTNSSGFPQLDEAACRIVTSRWRFKPASLLDGSPVAIWMPANIVFQLGGGAAIPPPADAATALANISADKGPLAGLILSAQADAKAGRFADAIAKARQADAMPGKPAAIGIQLHKMILNWAIQEKDYKAALDEAEKMIAANEGNRTENLKQALAIASAMKNEAKQKAFADQLGIAAPAPRVVRAAIGRLLQEAQKAIEMKDFAAALAKIEEADRVKDKTPYEEYMVSKYLGFIAINQPMPDYPAATSAYNREVESGAAPDAEKPIIYGVAMRLNYQAMNYAAVIEDATALKAIAPLDETSYLVLIQSYYNMMDYANVVGAVQEALIAHRMTRATLEGIQHILEQIVEKQAASSMPDQRVLRLLNVVRGLAHAAAGQNTSATAQRNTANPPSPPTPPIATTSHAVTADDYPPVSVRLQEQGKVQIKYTIAPDGYVSDCRVTHSSGKPRLDDAACTMAKKRWFFKPAIQDGRPVAVKDVAAEVIFVLK